MAQNTNLNASPYFDDFDANKNYQRVLFKPGVPIQARELTTLQSILQNQIEKFGKHFFKEGSVVIPGQVAFDPSYFYVQIDASHLGIPVSLYISELVGKYIKGETSGVRALVENYIVDTQSDNGNYTLYVKYQSSSEVDFSTNTFIDGENLVLLQDLKYSLSTIRENSSFATAIINGSTGSGSAAKIQEGVYFIRGFFVNVDTQTVILEQYSSKPSYRVGLLIEESITVASQSNPDLYDNARGFSNFAAPGADRFKLKTTLIKKSLNDFNDENFIELIRIENGIIKNFSKNNYVDSLKEELARRTYDESGDYYIIPYKVNVKESLNDQVGNNGVFSPVELTKQGNLPNEDLLCLQVSPGKAYVRGFEVETINTLSLDLLKPRTTDTDKNFSVSFTLGRQIELNNVYGSTPVGLGSTSIVNFYSNRTSTPGSSSGTLIGVGRIYDLKLKNAEYVNSSTKFQASLYDIQTYVYLNINASATINTPAFIEGKNSNASGYLTSSVSNSNQLILYQVSGSFIQNEPIKVNGEDFSRTITSVRDYDISDISQIVGTNGVSFTADTVLSRQVLLSPRGSSFTVSATSGGISTVTTSDSNFSVGIKTGDIVSYTKPGENIPTYSLVSNVVATLNQIQIQPTTSVVGVCSGTLPGSTITVSDFIKIAPQISNINQAYLFSTLGQEHVSNVDLTASSIIIKKSYPVSISSNGLNATLETDPNLTLEPFDEEDYNLTFSNGTVESLNSQKLTISGRTVTLQNISTNGSATLTVTFKKINIKSKKKIFNRCSTLIVDKSSSQSSGIGSTTLNDGLTYSPLYGTRIQDKDISLNLPDVQSVLAIYESSSSNEPTLPKLVLNNLNSNILNSIKGESIIGQRSNAVAKLVSVTDTNRVEFVYSNENSFSPGETVVFFESQITANVASFVEGDRDILSNYVLDPAQKLEYVDYSFITRKDNSPTPTKKLKIVFNNYTLDPTDTGDFVTVNSYDKDRYGDDIPFIDIYRGSDILDLRPRVIPYNPSTATTSPFEFNSRQFSSTTSSSPYNFSKDKSINLSYSYYLGRIDRLYLNRDGVFFINYGVPSLNPKIPNNIENALEVATIKSPPYVYRAEDVNVTLSPHKRYRMVDISNLEDRLKNVEYYTSLSLLESDTKNLTLRDEQTQLDRFKCGFFVDNFKSLFSGNISDPGYKCSIDTVAGNLRPQHYTTSLDLLLGSEAVIGASNTSNPDADLRFVTNLGFPNTKKAGDVVCLNYTDVSYVKNKFATRVENVNPFAVVNWIGTIELSPSTDTWVETRRTHNEADVEGSYASAVKELGADTNTGLAPIDWGAWETQWTGSSQKRDPLGKIKVGTEVASQSVKRNPRKKGRAATVTKTTNYKDKYTNFENVTTLSFNHQSRPGIQYKVGERFDTTNVGDRVVSTDVIHTMRSRNIEFIAKRMKPNTRLYPFFDNTNMASYFVPKLIEISMVSGTFVVGETVQGKLGTVSISFRLAKADHKYGPYNNPTQVYVQNPYNTAENILTSYSTTSTILNVDVASLELQSSSKFYGYITQNMQLVGQSSGAVAKVTDVRLITDNSGTIIGSLFIPNPILPSTPSFETGTKTFTLTTSSTNSTISGTSDSSAETSFTSSGTLSNVENTTLRIRNADISRETIYDQRVLEESDTEVEATTTYEPGTTVTKTTPVKNNNKPQQKPKQKAPEKSAPRPKTTSVTSQKTGAVIIKGGIVPVSIPAKAQTPKVNKQNKTCKWADPLAQSFEVQDPNGVFLTKCDIFFKSKDTTGIPVTLQVRTMQTGFPTQEILPFGEVVLEPNQVNISDDGQTATTFTFPSPVYLESGKAYCVVLLSASNSYTVWISRMGEQDVTTLNLAESEKILVSQQPLLGSLFKSQNGATWDPSQLEDLKFTLYRAEFYNGESSVRFYNPDLAIGNHQIVSLRPNPIECISKSTLVGVAKSLTTSEVSNLTPGITILQNNNPSFSAKLKSLVGAIGISSNLTLTSVGSGFTSTFTTYSNVNLISLDGKGVGAKVNLSVSGGVAVAATVSAGGTGYAYGNTLTVDYTQTGGFGKNLILTIPNTVGIISAFNTLIIDKVQGALLQDSTSNLIYVGAGGTSTISGANVTYITDLTDGLHFKVNHNNHGMYSRSDFVSLRGLESDQRPETLNSSYSSSSTSNIPLSSVGIFTSFENVPVSSTNPGYILLESEIIKYTGVDTDNKQLTGITRGIDSTVPSAYSESQQVFKYELNGVSLRRLNKDHDLSQVDYSNYASDLDYYYVKVGMNTGGVDRSQNNPNGFPSLFFNENKTCGSYDPLQLPGSYKTPKASQNIPFNVIRPNVQTILPQGTSISASIRTFSGGSPDNTSLSPFIDQGFEDISLSSDNYLSTPRIICSQVNENQFLQDYPGRKSFTLEFTLSTVDTRVSPMIDLDRVSIVTIGNRLNSKISNYATDPRVNSLLNDPTAASYVTKIVKLETGSDNLKVFFDAYRSSTSDIRVLYKLFRSDSDPTTQLWELFPGYDNLDQDGKVISASKNNGRPDKNVTPSSSLNEFKSYEFTAKNLPLFNGFQIKILMTGTNSTYTPLIKDLRVIASV